jgi:hypothetical protein
MGPDAVELKSQPKGLDPMANLHPINLNNAITSALDNIATLSDSVYTHWYNELFTVKGEPIQDSWNENNLYLMEKDVENLFWKDYLAH